MAAAEARRPCAATATPADRRTMARAFSLCNMKPVFWKIRAMIVDSSSPVACAVVLAISFHTLWASGPHDPPHASIIIGMKDIPSDSQLAYTYIYIYSLYTLKR